MAGAGRHRRGGAVQHTHQTSIAARMMAGRLPYLGPQAVFPDPRQHTFPLPVGADFGMKVPERKRLIQFSLAPGAGRLPARRRCASMKRGGGSPFERRVLRGRLRRPQGNVGYTRALTASERPCAERNAADDSGKRCRIGEKNIHRSLPVQFLGAASRSRPKQISALCNADPLQNRHDLGMIPYWEGCEYADRHLVRVRRQASSARAQARGVRREVGPASGR